jgi:hypothetical protein
MSALALYGLTKEIGRLKKRLRRKNLDDIERDYLESKLIDTEKWLEAELRGWEERRQERVGSN